jgi:beta-N-acetylhexosaminidase
MGADAASAVVMGALAGAELSREEHDFLCEFGAAGVTLFSRNIALHNPVTSDSPQSLLPQRYNKVLLQKLLALLQKLRPHAAPPLLIAIDQEGGRVARLKYPFPDRGPALRLVDERADEEAQNMLFAYGREVGASLLDLGINVNFAPVLDVQQKDTHDSIGDRAFAGDPERVGVRAKAFLQGMQSAGVLGCLKHFPGQGGARSDTHLHSARVDKPLAELTACDLLPFADLMPHAPMVMLGHCVYSCLDQREASLSSVVIEGLLRKKMGFSGVAVSDDMTMAAVHKPGGDFGDTVVAAVESGIDLVLVCKDLGLWRQAVTALRQGAKESPAFGKRLAEAAERVNKMRAAFVLRKNNLKGLIENASFHPSAGLLS